MGIIIGVAGLLILIAFAYGGYRRSMKAQATARAHGVPRTLAPAGDAEIVKGIPAGNAAVAHKPAAQPADLEPPEETALQCRILASAMADPVAHSGSTLRRVNRARRRWKELSSDGHPSSQPLASRRRPRANPRRRKRRH